nr:low temperature requirement protein A [Psychrobacter sp. PraFG1]UNK05257.1 low temperature requirement protein A [Psychrobacter sp. PraFG1]
MSLPHIWPISARDTHEPNRASTPLELLFDLVYVIAISAAAQGLYKDLLAHEYAGFITFTVAFLFYGMPGLALLGLVPATTLMTCRIGYRS